MSSLRRRRLPRISTSSTTRWAGCWGCCANTDAGNKKTVPRTKLSAASRATREKNCISNGSLRVFSGDLLVLEARPLARALVDASSYPQRHLLNDGKTNRFELALECCIERSFVCGFTRSSHV